MMRWLSVVTVVSAGMALAAPAAYGDWTFRRSNYSHSPSRGVEVGPNRFSRGPYFSSPTGAVVRSGYRNLNSNHSYRGGTWDHLNYNESWIQFSEQF